MTPNERRRRPHSRTGRTAQTRHFQALRGKGWKPTTMWEPSMLIYWRVAHRRLRSRHERRQDWWRKCWFEREGWDE